MSSTQIVAPVRYRRKTYPVWAMRWAGGIEAAVPVISWIKEHGHTAEYSPGLRDSAASTIHEPWTDQITIDGEQTIQPGEYVVLDSEQSFFYVRSAAGFEDKHEIDA